MATAVDAPTATKTRGKILIVDDELVVRDSLGKWFASEGYTARPAGGAREALETHPADAEFDIALLDIKMPGMDGMELQARLHEADPDLTVIIMTGYASVETAVQALKHGAYDYITKPVDPDELSHLVANALEHKRARREVVRLRENLQEVFPSTELIGKSPAMKKVMELIEMVAPTEATVLITGESGTGKEVVARAIHAAGPRRYMPMVTIHCGALTETLLESELFGHEKGAFTGAQYRKKGKFEVADGGTRLPRRDQRHQPQDANRPAARAAGKGDRARGRQPADQGGFPLHRRHQQEPGGAGESRDPSAPTCITGCTSSASTCRRCASAARTSRCWSTISSTSSAWPPAAPMPQLSAEALEVLMRHDWPGNVRELENAVERALVVGRGSEIRPADFSFQFQADEPKGGKTLDDVERAHIERILRETQHNLSRAARILDIDRTTLYNKLRRYGLR